MSIAISQHVLLDCHFTKIIKGTRTSFQSSKMNQKHVGSVCHNLHYPLTKFHFDTIKDSKEVIIKLTSDMY